MAEKRMISKVISISKKFNISLNEHFSRLLYLLLIPHSDDFGRLSGDPYKVKALILPMMNDVTWEQVESSLAKLHNSKLIIWYESDEEMYIQIINFEDHQSGLHKRTRSKFPEPPRDSVKFPEIPSEENRTEEKGIEEKGVSRQDDRDLILSKVNSMKLKCRGEFELSKVYSYIGVMETELILESLNRCEVVRKVSYALGILVDWHESGYTKMSDISPKKNVASAQSEKEAEIQQRLAQERKNAEAMTFKPEFEDVSA